MFSGSSLSLQHARWRLQNQTNPGRWTREGTKPGQIDAAKGRLEIHSRADLNPIFLSKHPTKSMLQVSGKVDEVALTCRSHSPEVLSK